MRETIAISARVTPAKVTLPVVGERSICLQLDKAITGILLVAIIFTALAHGAVEPWSIGLFEVIVLAMLMLWFARCMVARRLEINIPSAAFPIIALLVVGLVQSFGLSLDVEATRHAVLMMFFLTASFLVAANFLVGRKRLFLFANVLTVFGALVAGFALIQSFTWDGRLYWMRSTSATAFGPFINHNHFAGYMAMLIPVPLGMVLKAARGPAQVVYGFAAALMGTAAMLSGSRSGVICLAAALILIAVLNARFSRSRLIHESEQRRISIAKIGPIGVVALAMIAGAVWIGAAQVVERFGEAIDGIARTGAADLSRAMIWRDTLPIIRDHPILGAGFGAYRTVYPTYAKTEELFGLDYAHSDYLQVLADAGIVGGVFALWFIVLLVRAISRAVHARDPLRAGWALAATGGIFAVAVQTMSDTDLQIPSNALLFLVLSAVVMNVGVENRSCE